MMDLIPHISQIAKNNQLPKLLELSKGFVDAERVAVNDALSFFERPYKLASTIHLNTHRQPMDFTDKPYLIPIYYDIHPEKVIQKSVQCGISEMLLCWAFVYAEYGYSVLYVLPKFGLRNRFVQNRVDPVWQMVPEYRQLRDEAVGDADNLGLKHFGKGTINFVGSNSSSEFIEFPADVVMIDELNQCDVGNISMAFDRLDASDLKHKIWVGNPSHPEWGISAEYEKSDKKEWMIKCESCNKYQSLQWIGNVVRQEGENIFNLLDTTWDANNDGDISVLCISCGKPFNRLTEGAWIKQNPQSLISGYHISQLFSANTTIAELWKLFQESLGDATKSQVFWNSKMGLPYVPAGSNLNRLLLDNCKADYLLQSKCEQHTSMGVDVGKRLHVRISSRTDDGKRKAEYIGVVNTFEELPPLMERYKVRFCVIDAYPETHKAKEFQAANRGVWLCRFPSTANINVFRLNDDDMVIDADRTQIFDQLVASVDKGDLILPKNVVFIDDYYEQMQAPVRMYDEVKDRYYWSEGSKADHYFLAEVYDLLASYLIEHNQLVIY